ncbi:MAG: septum formation initiator family protein [Alphaproteobacteria bacterium]|nr:septum formation initiator family protein [Alphaproteobacteria bacterium]
MSRPLTWILLVMVIILQGQLWLGRGSMPDVMQLRETLAEQKINNQQAIITNQRLEAELRDLNDGREMIEERARREIGMLKQGEIFVQYSRSKP